LLIYHIRLYYLLLFIILFSCDHSSNYHQHRYDAAITEKALTERKNLWLTIAIAALSAMVLALLAVVYLSRKAKEYKGIIDKNIEHIYQAEQKIELLQSTGKDYEHEIKVLKEQLPSQASQPEITAIPPDG